MQFTHSLITDIENGIKTQTRRTVKPIRNHYPPYGDYSNYASDQTISNVVRDGCLKYRVGSSYAVQPGRGKFCIVRSSGQQLRIVLDAIRHEDVRNIALEDLTAEGNFFYKRKASSGYLAMSSVRFAAKIGWEYSATLSLPVCNGSGPFSIDALALDRGHHHRSGRGRQQCGVPG